MFQIDTSTAVSSNPTPGVAGTPGWFTKGDPVNGVAATTLSADFMNGIQAEFLSILTKVGVSPSKTLFNQVLTSLARLGGWNVTNVTGATTTALTADSAGLVTATISGNSTITLPAANAFGGAPGVVHLYRLDSVSGASLTIAPAGSDQINGAGSGYSVGAGTRLTFVSNGSTGWFTSTSSNNLHVLGTLIVDGTTTLTSALTVNNNITATGTITSSAGLIGTNSNGNRTISASNSPTGGVDGDLWYSTT